NADGSVNTGMMGTDDLHPDVFGYTTMAVKWAGAIWSYLGTTPTTYNLTVVNGLGGGSYPAGVSMSISASPAGTGSQFSYWSPAILPLSNPYWPLATYVMPAAATTLNANDVSSGSPILPNGTYRITSLFAGDGLAVGAAGTSSGSLVQQQTYTGSATQQWTLANLGNNVVELTLAGTNTALEVVGASKTVGANINVATYTGATNQQWTITPQAGATELVNVNSGLAIEIGYSTQPGAQLDQDTVGNGPIQWWAFYPLGPAPVITSSLTASATAGTAFSYQITASNSPTSYNATGLPAGLKVNTATGLISGTPTVSGTFPIMISATSATGTTTVTLTLTLAASTDTPTMPQWALLLLAALLFGVAARQRQPASWLPFFSRIRVFSTALSEWRRLSQTRAGKESLFHILKKRIIVPDQILVDRGFIFYVF
ncbi:MAG: IPTL-CTERM sorting domain-containing protein, partial [Methylacidiphilales bacterium]|nr:IPTL-CTERM sorting domain-containing protein [Candidatus Methylacidiphilales bacterium]